MTSKTYHPSRHFTLAAVKILYGVVGEEWATPSGRGSC